MGSWYKTCGISNLYITGYEKVLVFVLEQKASQYEKSYTTSFFRPVLLPFYSTYADYGEGKDSHGIGYQYIMNALKEQLIEMPLGENQYHDIEVSREKWNEQLFFDSIHESRLKIKANMYGDESLIDFVMIRKDIVDYILKNWKQTDYVGGEAHYISYYFDDILADLPEYINIVHQEVIKLSDANIMYHFDLSRLFNYNHPNKVAKTLVPSTYRYSNLIDISKIISELLLAGNKEGATELIKDYLIGSYIELFLSYTRKQWIPGGHEGSQTNEHEPYEVLIAATQAVIANKKEESEIDYFNNDESNIPINWQNVLNYKHLPSLGWNIETFRSQAQTLGFPYFCWNDRIYNTTTGEDTDFVKDDVK